MARWCPSHATIASHPQPWLPLLGSPPYGWCRSCIMDDNPCSVTSASCSDSQELLIPWNWNQKYQYVKPQRPAQGPSAHAPTEDATPLPATAGPLQDTASHPASAQSPASSEAFSSVEALAAAQATAALTPEAKGDSDLLYYRYHHLFTKDELLGLLAQVEGVHVLSIDSEKDNWVVVACRD